MATFSELKALVADDLSRSDLTTQIEAAVLDAIEYHKAERFWFNETRGYTFATVSGTSDYTIAETAGILDFIKLDYVQVTIGTNNSYMLTRILPAEMEDLLSVSFTGQPSSYAYYNSTFRLYPIPDAAYTVRVAGHCQLSALSASTDTNAWTTHAKNLIRATAKKFVNARKIRNMDMAQIAQADENLELDRLRRETSRRVARGVIQPWM